MTKTVVGLYDDYQEAESTVRDLVDNGFQREDISYIAQDATHGNQPVTHTGDEATHDSAADGAAAGAGTGAVLGGLAGLVIGLGALAIPGIGPIIAAGPLATALAGAGVGAVAGGLIGALVDAGVPREQAEAYAEGVRRGGTLVTMRSPDDRASQARDIMNRHHPIDLADRSHVWRSQGISEGTTNTSPYTSGGMETSHDTNMMSGQTAGGNYPSQGTTGDMSVMDRERMMDEQQGTGSGQNFGQQSTFDRDRMSSQPSNYQSGRDTGYEESATQRDLTGQGTGGYDQGTFQQDRDMADQGTLRGSQGMSDSGQGTFGGSEYDQGTFGSDRGMSNSGQGTFENERDMANERTFGGSEYDQGFQSDRDMAPRQDLTGTGHGDWETRDVNRIVGSSQGQSMGQWRDFSSFDQEFRDHYVMLYSASKEDYTFYEPAYRYGYDAANSERYQGRRWSEIEPELQRNWQQTNPNNPWDNFRDAVRYGWERTSAASGGTDTGMGGTGQDLGSSSSEDYGTGTTFSR